MLEADTKKYQSVKTAADLIRLGVKPKTSAAHLALITSHRLRALRDNILAQINDDTLGSWVSPFAGRMKSIDDIVKEPNDIVKYIHPGMQVQIPNGGVKGKVLSVIPNSRWDRGAAALQMRYDIVWEKSFEGGVDLGGRCSPGFGGSHTADQFQLLTGGKIAEGYDLAEGVVANDKVGHLVRFLGEYARTVKIQPQNTSYGYTAAVDVTIKILSGQRAQLIAFDAEKQLAGLLFKDNLPGTEFKTIHLPAQSLDGILQVSSLGQFEPKDKEVEVKRYVFQHFFPKTRLDFDRAQYTLQAMLMGKDMAFHGPWGSGKSQVCRDIIQIGQLQKYIFVVEGCDSQCSPFSLLDEEFAQEVQPCAKCKIRFDETGKFRETGFFKPKKPEDIPVVSARLGSGFGVELLEGTVDVSRDDLVGYKLPQLPGAGIISHNEYDPEGFKPGKLPRTNNGYFHIEELDKFREPAQANLLEALNSNRVQPNELRFPSPSNNVVLATLNDTSRINLALIDRMVLLAIRYSDDPDIADAVIRVGYYGERTALTDVPIPDTHLEQGQILKRSICAPWVIDQAVTTFYRKFRAEYKGAGRSELWGSNRSMLDSLEAARARLLIDQIFFQSTPSYVDATYMMKGIQYAICSRVTETSMDAGQRAKKEVNVWVEKEFPEILKMQLNKWWCQTLKDISIAKRRIPELEDHLFEELKLYQQNPATAWEIQDKVKQAYDVLRNDQRNQPASQTLVQYPFMDYLFRNQPDNVGSMALWSQQQVVDIVHFYLSSRDNNDCWQSLTKKRQDGN